MKRLATEGIQFLIFTNISVEKMIFHWVDWLAENKLTSKITLVWDRKTIP